MDYETAKTLELMAEQYYFEASRIEVRIPELTAALGAVSKRPSENASPYRKPFG
jgi:hypothetical protein